MSPVSGNGREAIVASTAKLVAAHGRDATSLRMVAKAAGVSPALVVHHFGGRAQLLGHIDELAVGIFAAAYADTPTGLPAPELLRLRAAQTARVMREHPDLCDYIGRTLASTGPAARSLFAAMLAAGRSEVERLRDAGGLRPDADVGWTTLQHFLLIWAPLAFRGAIESELLGGSLFEEPHFGAWVAANTELLQEGVYRDG